MNNIREEVKMDFGEDLGTPPPGEDIVSELKQVVDEADRFMSNPDIPAMLD